MGNLWGRKKLKWSKTKHMLSYFRKQVKVGRQQGFIFGDIFYEVQGTLIQGGADAFGCEAVVEILSTVRPRAEFDKVKMSSVLKRKLHSDFFNYKLQAKTTKINRN